MKQLRPLVATVTAPLIRLLAKTSITPNQLTVVGTALTGAVAAAVAVADGRLAGPLVLGASAFDLLDGALARSTGRTSRFGAFLDSTLDRVADGLLLFGVAVRGVRAGSTTTPLLAFVAYGASVLVSYSRARAEAVGVQGEAGFFDRPARIVTLAAGLAINRLNLALLVIAAGASATVVQRVLLVRRQLPN
ncbi:MAG: CDP-alcohol phosphatidyltransferase family protein [Dehalococcoidia bacterium]